MTMSSKPIDSSLGLKEKVITKENLISLILNS
jgi:hypothetical protein